MWFDVVNCRRKGSLPHSSCCLQAQHAGVDLTSHQNKQHVGKVCAAWSHQQHSMPAGVCSQDEHGSAPWPTQQAQCAAQCAAHSPLYCVPTSAPCLLRVVGSWRLKNSSNKARYVTCRQAEHQANAGDHRAMQRPSCHASSLAALHSRERGSARLMNRECGLSE